MDPAQLLFGFHGRIRRRTYWMTGLGAASTVALAAYLLSALTVVDGGRFSPVLYPALLLLAAIETWMGVALGVKRFHDRGKSGWWMLVGLVPALGWIWLLIDIGLLEGTSGPNRFGSPPKDI